jgi:hypothetical protein
VNKVLMSFLFTKFLKMISFKMMSMTCLHFY